MLITETAVALLGVACTACRSLSGLEEAKAHRGSISEVTLRLDGESYLTKMSDPDENLLSDANIYIFDGRGMAEEHLWVSLASGPEIKLDLDLGKSYRVFVFANAGYRMPDYDMASLEESIWYLSRPDSYRHGIPMAGESGEVTIPQSGVLTLRLERLMSKLTLRVDRSRLNEDIEFNIKSVRIGNCPKCTKPFSASRITDKSQLFSSGFYKSGDECADLNWSDGNCISDPISVYLLENQADSLNKALCPYIEMEIDYLSDYWHSSSERGLIYRFYICEKHSYKIERNCHYRVSVRPAEDGLLCDDSWRVDKSSLTSTEGLYYMKIVPEGTMVDGTFYPFYYELDKNGSMHFDLDLFPRDITVTLREDLVEDELNEGRARYEMDSDGKGFTVTALGRECMSLMELTPSSPLGEDDAQTICISIK